MAVVLTILKIIGIVLLCIIGFLLFNILLVLFGPITYKSSGKYDGDTDLRFSAHYLGPVVSVKGSYVGKESNITIRICGIRPPDAEKRAVKKAKKAAKKAAKEAKKHPKEEKPQLPAVTEPEVLPEETVQSTQTVNETAAAQEPASEQEEPKKGNPLKKIGDMIIKTGDKIREVYGIASRAKEILTERANQEMLKKVFSMACRMLKKILPRRWKVQGVYGFEDPSLTGRITGGIAMFYPVYAGHLFLCPDFEEKVFRAEGYAKGHFCMFPVVLTGIRVYLNKQFRRFLKQAQSLKNADG